MTRENYIRIAIAFLISFLISCSKDEDAPVEDPILHPTANTELMAHMGDTISIKGSNLESESIYAQFDDGIYTRGSQILQVTDSTIQMVVPTNLEYHIQKIQIFIANQDLLEVDFSLYRPEIDSLSQDSIFYDDIITIYGQHFDYERSRMRLQLNSEDQEILYASRDSVQFKVPSDLSSVTFELEIDAQLQNILHEKSIALKFPVIESVTTVDGGGRYETLIITGDYFNPNFRGNTIFFNEHSVVTSSGTTRNRIEVRIPEGPFPNRNCDITLKTIDYQALVAQDYPLTDDWILVSNSIPFYFERGPGVFNYNGEIFAMAPDLIDWKVSVFKLDPNDYSWSLISDVPETINVSKAVQTQDGIYVYGSQEDLNFFKFSLVDFTWQQLSSFPGTSRFKPTIFSNEENVYLGIGVENADRDNRLSDFFKYDIESNEWSEIDGLPGFNRYINASGFVIGQYAYVVGGATNTGMDEAWKFDLLNQTWEEIEGVGYPVNYTHATEYNGKGYVTTRGFSWPRSNEFWEYDPLLGIWKKLPDIEVDRRNGVFIFQHEGILYFGGGSEFNEELYQLDPTLGPDLGD